MQTPTRPAGADVRTRVLDAARAVFFEHGYQRATLEAIAQRAGFSKGAVYSNFSGKHDLFLQVVDTELRRMRDTVTQAVLEVGDRMVPPGTPEERLRRDLRLGAKALLTLARSGREQLVYAEFRARAAGDPDLAARTAQLRADLVQETAQQLQVLIAQRGHRLAVPAIEATVVIMSLGGGLALEQVGRADEVASVRAVAAVLGGLILPGTRG